MANGDNGDVAIDAYHRYPEDVAIASGMNLDIYRFSISWARVLPNGTYGQVNEKGVDYYIRLIEEIIDNGLEPYVTLFHWDFPQVLADEFGGFLSEKMVAEFEHYVDVCFSRFGDRVKNWITLNEPWTFAAYGYDSGSMAPGRCSEWMDLNCTGGDSGTEPYNVTHNLILSHLAAVRRYWRYYKPRQEGRIGITLVAQWYEPCNVSNGDAEAADRQMSFFLGWYLGPIVNGVYPDDMIEHVGERLPTFTDEQTQELQHSFDFLGVNYYTAFYVNNTPSDPTKLSYTTDSQALTSACCNDQRIAQPAGSSTWLNVYPIGLKKLLLHIRDTYGDLPMIITENGASLPDDSSVEASLNDTDRRDYISDHLCCLHQSINEDGMDVSGYVAWSLTDNLEWCQGFTQRFGLNYVNVTENNNFTRTPKLSAEWFTDFLRREPEPSISLKAGDTIDSLYSTSI